MQFKAILFFTSALASLAMANPMAAADAVAVEDAMADALFLRDDDHVLVVRISHTKCYSTLYIC